MEKAAEMTHSASMAVGGGRMAAQVIVGGVVAVELDQRKHRWTKNG